jgi:zinc protease
MALQKAFIAGTALLVLAGQVNAQTKGKTASKPVATSKPAAGSLAAPVKVTSVEGITEYRLSNGLQVLLFPDPSKPTITVNVTYKVGSRHEGYGETGMAHLLEHMVFKGSPKHPNIPAELTSHGASPNGTTYYDRTNYFETFSATDENLNWALDMESDRMINSFIADKDLRSEFSVVRNEFERGENNPSGVLMERILSTAYLWHNYGKSTIGSREDIEKVPIQNLQAFYKKYYQPDNAVVIVAGKIDEAKTLELVNKYFGVIPRPERILDKTYTVEPTQDGERFVELRRVGDIQSIACAYHIPSGTHKDYAAIDVLNEVLTNEPNGRLYQSLVKAGKASTTWSWAAGLHDAGFIYINADVLKEKSLDDAKTTMFSTLEGFKAKPVTAEEVEKGKSKLMKEYETAFRNTGRVGLLLSEFIAQGDWRTGFLYRDNLKKVTAADVNRVANAYLVNSNRTYGVFIPTNNPVRADIPESPNVEALVKDYKGQEALAAGEEFDSSPENIDKRTEVVKMTSGAKYSLLTKVNRGNTVEARITLRLGDEASMNGKSAVAEMTAQMLKRGTSKRTMAQINETLDKLQSSVNISGSGQTVSINIQSTRKELPQVLDLVTEILHEPAFAADEFKTIVSENISGYEQERSEPQAVASRELGRITNTFPKGHIFYAMSVDEELAALKAVTIDDVKKFHKDYYNGSSATAAFVGDFDAATVKQRVNNMLDNWSAVKSYTRVANPYKNIPAQDKEFITPDKKNAMFLCALPLKMKDDHPDYAALTMGNFVFGGGFLNSRLATRIRQKEGLSYGVGSFLQASSLDESGSFGSYAIYNPDVKAKLMTVYKEELMKLINEGITEDELKAAKSGIGQYRQNGRAQDGALAGKLNSNIYLGRQMAWDKEMDDKLQALTVADVNAALKKNLDANKIIYVKAGDFK